MSEMLRQEIRKNIYVDEVSCLNSLIKDIDLSDFFLTRVRQKSVELSHRVRENRLNDRGLGAFLHSYDLTSNEGISLMCLAEALLRIPDAATQDRLINDKITNKDWAHHSGRSHSFFVNATTRALMILDVFLEKKDQNRILAALKCPIALGSAPFIRVATVNGVKALGREFIIGENIEVALRKAKKIPAYRYSYDMLGETAKTAKEAERYFQAYQKAIRKVGEENTLSPIGGAGISVKLSALHPRYEWRQAKRVQEELFPRLKTLAQQAKSQNIGLTIDAEEVHRLEPSLDLLEKLILDPTLDDWDGLGIAVQAYQKRATFVIDWLIALARKSKRRLLVRLVKGAYWDTEIKWAQERGFSEYPVFTRKSSTDVSYFVCAQKLLKATDAVYPQFATHNAYTVASILELAGDSREFEFQCLYGMGSSLYDHLVADKALNVPCRMYAPVGNYKDLLSYLIRRLLENGASTSFVHCITDDQMQLEELLIDPIVKTRGLKELKHPKIPLPPDLYGKTRRNARGLDLDNPMEIYPMQDQIKTFFPTLFDKPVESHSIEEMENLLARAHDASRVWDQTPLEHRALCLEKMATLIEENQAQFMALLIREGGKTLQDAISEVREAVDFCRYYASRVRIDFTPQVLSGPTGEHNQVSLHGRGVFLCISPWNFPLAIFLGQVTAALAAGNTVLAKSATQTPLVAALAVALLHKAGIPETVVQLVVVSGKIVGERLIPDPRIKGVMLTGSTDTAEQINRTLAARTGSIVPFIAETGGQNAMIVDASAFPEQVVNDVILSAFGSAGQRCSALRVLFIQEEVATHIIGMLKGAMQELSIGDPFELSTDVGPVIDASAAQGLLQHVERMNKEAELIFECSLPKEPVSLPKGVLFAPRAYEIKDIRVLKEEIFGPILHVVRYRSKDLDKVIDSINATGYGLTLGIHSRIDQTIDYIRTRVHVGNTYVNRNMIGAVVGVQPFGGEGLSGTGPKAGGSHLLPRLAVEHTLSVNTTAVGGNTKLISLEE